MAIGTINNMIIRPEFFEAGFMETLDQNVNVFNAGSGNALRFVTRSTEGDYEKTRFWDRISGLISHRDDTSNSSVTPSSLDQSEHIAVKTKRKIGPVSNTIDSLRSVASSAEEFSFRLGQLVGEEAAKDYLNTGILSLVAALTNQSSVFQDDSGDANNTLDHARLNTGMGLFGDRRQALSVIVCHSKAYTDLVGNNISSAGDQTEFATIYNEQPGSFNRPVVVTDSDELVNSDGITTGTDSYYTLILQPNALEVAETDMLEMWDDRVLEEENVRVVMQGESAITLDMKGFTWDETNGGRNPQDAALGTGTNWDPDVTNYKDYGGVIIEHA